MGGGGGGLEIEGGGGSEDGIREVDQGFREGGVKEAIGFWSILYPLISFPP